MKRRSGEALLLQTIDLHERDRIVVFLSRDWGLKRGAARSARARFSRFGGELQQLAKVHLSWFEKPDRDLVRLGDAEMIRSPGALHTDLEGILVSSYLAEHMQVFAQEHEPDNHLYRLLDSTVQALIARLRSLPGGALPGMLDPAAERRVPGPPGTVRRAAPRSVTRPSWRSTRPACCALHAAPARARIAGSASPLFPSCAASAPRTFPGLQENGGVEESTLKSVEAIAREVRRAFLGKELRSYGVMQRTLRDVAP